MDSDKFIIGTSGYSYEDWVGPFYPPGTRKRQMFDSYVQAFPAVEVNYSFYSMPTARTLESMVRRSPPAFDFWIKAHQQFTHEGNLRNVSGFLDALTPMRDAGKLAGVLLQFPQSFHRTVANRRYLASAIEALAGVPLAVEFRHFSWDRPSSLRGLRDRDVTLVIPDSPQIGALYRPRPALTTTTGYLRPHSRNADNWYAGAVERYDYDYSQEELTELAREWSELEKEAERIYVFFNNCHSGQAALNAESFRKILQRISV